VSYAQNREDILLSGFFEDGAQGFYVDVGASHPEEMSVTKFFYERGWQGINIEPIPRLYNLLKQKRPRDINLNLGVAKQSGQMQLREYPKGDGLSTFSKEMHDQYEKGDYRDPTIVQDYVDYDVPVAPLADIFEKYNVNSIQFLKIDVEGFEKDVIASNDWQKYRPEVICIEANHIVEDWRPHLRKHHYKQIFFDGLNEYYVDENKPEIEMRFSYPETILSTPVIPVAIEKLLASAIQKVAEHEYKVVKKEQELQAALALNERLATAGKELKRNLTHLSSQYTYLKSEHEQLIAENDHLKDSLKDSDEQIETILRHARFLEGEVARYRRIRSQIRYLIKSLDAAALAQIKRLDRQMTQVEMPYGLDLSTIKSSDRNKLIASIRQSDIARLYSPEPIPTTIYKLAYKTYVTPTRLIYKVIYRKKSAGEQA
ncbi:MAG TPA: FkbM family methyltransferase, partial [Candidatus Saccharimonadales bacterium]|nr:FkbM family methyltransferase [Candidatus Saccharimonadales bacterium]